MAKQKSANSAVIIQRSRASISLPPCTLGFASLTEPDTYDPEKPMFKLNAHLNPNGIEATKRIIQAECYDKQLEKLRAQMADNTNLKNFVSTEPQDPAAWLAGKLKEPKENAKVQLPYIVIGCKAKRKSRSGEEYTVEIGCWDSHNNPLDLKALKLGMGSIIEPVVNANLFISKLIGFPQPKFDLVGVRVLKRVAWGGQRPPQETDEDAIKEVLGEEFEADEDLSAFAAGAALPGAAPGDPSTDDTVAGAF